MSSVSPRVSVPWYRQPLVWMLIAIPLSSVIMGVVIITLSITSYDGLVVDDYYKRGLEINRVLDRDAAARRDALSATLRLAAHGTRVRVAASDAVGLPPAVDLRLSHATRAGQDRLLTLARTADGDYAGSGVSLGPGRWYVELGTPRWRLTGVLLSPGRGILEMRPTP